ncbi:MAG: hypothetical protein EXR62_15345 [Chloroflexi bacterium]|nr:hypothetical protein [Chloroflexota bacterium]
MSKQETAIFPVVVGTLGAGSLSGVATWAALVLPQPWAWAGGAVAVVSGLWTVAGALAIARLLSSVGPATPDPGPDPEPPRPRWEVVDGQAGAVGMEIELIPGLRAPQPQPLLVQKANVSSPEDLTRSDVLFLLWWIYRHRRWSRRALKSRRTGPMLPRTGKRVTDYQYKELMRVLTEAEIVQERREAFTGYLCVQKLSEALQLFGFDPEKDWSELAATVPHCTALAPVPRFVVTRVVEE